MNCRVNGTEYETTQVVTEELMSEANLADVKIDGVPIGKRILLHIYVTGDVYHFALREQTETEKMVAQLVDTKLALVEMYEMMLG